MFYPPPMWVDHDVVNGETFSVPVTDAYIPLVLNLNIVGLILTWTMTFPITNVADGQSVVIVYGASTGSIAALAMNVENGGTILQKLTALGAGAGGIYRFRKSNSTWYKVPSA